MGAGERTADAVDFIEESQLSTEEVAVNCGVSRRWKTRQAARIPGRAFGGVRSAGSRAEPRLPNLCARADRPGHAGRHVRAQIGRRSRHV